MWFGSFPWHDRSDLRYIRNDRSDSDREHGFVQLLPSTTGRSVWCCGLDTDVFAPLLVLLVRTWLLEIVRAIKYTVPPNFCFSERGPFVMAPLATDKSGRIESLEQRED